MSLPIELSIPECYQSFKGRLQGFHFALEWSLTNCRAFPMQFISYSLLSGVQNMKYMRINRAIYHGNCALWFKCKAYYLGMGRLFHRINMIMICVPSHLPVTSVRFIWWIHVWVFMKFRLWVSFAGSGYYMDIIWILHQLMRICKWNQRILLNLNFRTTHLH